MATATAVTRLLDAGADLAGKTHTDEMAYSLTGENVHYGTPVNPRAPDRTPGGSSNGSAAAVTAWLVDFAIGTDCGGSVRLPASYCGIFGMRPTVDRVPFEGVIPFGPPFDVAGWFARDAGVLERVGRVLLADDSEPAPPRRMLRAIDAFDLVGASVSGALDAAVEAVAACVGAVEDVTVAPERLESWFQGCMANYRWLIWPTHIAEKSHDPGDDFRSEGRHERLSSPRQGWRIGAGDGAQNTHCAHRSGGYRFAGRERGGSRGRRSEGCTPGAGGHRGPPWLRESAGRAGAPPASGGGSSRSPARRTLGRVARRLPVNFWDTSALVALGVEEPHRQLALRILEADDRMAVWWGAPVEYVAALSRRERDGSLTTAEVSEHLVRLHALSQVWYEVQPGRRVRALAQRLLRVHPLRAADSLQLAAALAVAEEDPSSVGFVCFDARLNQAASREGFALLASQGQ